MFHAGDSLRTWATPVIDGWTQDFSIMCHALVEHRIRYLDYEGEISGGRGSVTRVVAGEYLVIDDSPDRFAVQMIPASGNPFPAAEVILQRICVSSGFKSDESRADWSLVWLRGR